jgi:hypothetical protein
MRKFRLLSAFMLFSLAFAQTPSSTPVPTNENVKLPVDPQFSSRRNQQRDPIEVRMEKDREKALQKERFDNLKKDTDRLLKLATELKENVEKSSKDTLSLEVIRKTEEIEKLAKSVREKMKSY